MSRAFKTWFVSLVLTAASVWVCFRWLDKPIALWIHDVFGERRVPTEFADRILSLPLLAAIVFVICGLNAIMGRSFKKFEYAIAMGAISTLATIVIKDQLKFAFGRTWPDAWGPGIVSLVRDNAYGFHFFHSGKSFESFPSGHAAVAAAVLSIAWILFPNLRVVWAIGVIGVDIGLLALNLHFLGDVLAGSFVGISAGLFTVALWRASAPEMQIARTDSVASDDECMRRCQTGSSRELPQSDG
jgi:membrane-associated phospholipid phosphatase